MNDYINFRILHGKAFEDVYDSSDPSISNQTCQIVEWTGISGIDDASSPTSIDISFKDFGFINLEEYKWASDDQIVDYWVIRDSNLYQKFFRLPTENIICSNLMVLLLKSGQIKIIHVFVQGNEFKFSHEEVHSFKTKNWTIFKNENYSSKIWAYIENFDDK